MDMKRKSRIPNCGSVPDLKKFKIVVGAKQLRKAVNNGSVRYVFLADNADPALTEPLATLCAENSIPVTWVGSMSELGRACGIEVGAAAAAVLNGSNG